jgi:hypothetical protein
MSWLDELQSRKSEENRYNLFAPKADLDSFIVLVPERKGRRG